MCFYNRQSRLIRCLWGEKTGLDRGKGGKGKGGRMDEILALEYFGLLVVARNQKFLVSIASYLHVIR